MPSPFPGMDPYLEDSEIWRGVHHYFITFTASALNTVLPPRYVAAVDERLYLVQPDRDIYPDVRVQQVHRGRSAKHPSSVGSTATVAADPPWVLNVEPVEVSEGFIDIILPAEGRRVITTIEFLSPSNKRTGSEGRELYRAKQHEVLASDTHLVEIDLLRRGEHTVAAPLQSLLRKGAWDYLVSLSRGGQRDRCEVWAFTLRQPLPRISVPLTGKDPDVPLDLQIIFDRVYDDGAYGRRLNYRDSPTVALPPADLRWANALLRKKAYRGRRPGRSRKGGHR
jgi:hypothetical protein